METTPELNGSRTARTKRFVSDNLLDRDFYAGAVVGVGTFVLVWRSSSVRADGDLVMLLLGLGAVGIAITGVVLTALSIVVSTMGDEYLRVIDRAGGLKRAMAPYLATAVLSGVTAVAGFCSALVWGVGNQVAQTIGMSLSMLMAVWSIAAAVDLVSLTAFHGQQRGAYLAGLARMAQDLRQISEQRRKTGS